MTPGESTLCVIFSCIIRPLMGSDALPMMFKNREQAARLLAGRMHHLRGSHPLILSIPRGGVPVGDVLADSLLGELDVVIVQKLGFPNNPEVALGAVDESGSLFINEHMADYGITDEYIQREKERQLDIIKSRIDLYMPIRPGIGVFKRTVIVVDDGTATGFAMCAALRATARHEPTALIAALAIASPDALKRIQDIADEVFCLYSGPDIERVGKFFEEFPHISDDDVMNILSKRQSPFRNL